MVLLNEVPQKPNVITGFPGFGLVGSIATEFLLEHLETREIGKIFFEELPATVAIHKGKIITPIGIYYHEPKNLVLIHSIVPLQGLEWKVTEKLKQIFAAMQPWRILHLDGVASTEEDENIYYYALQESIQQEIETKQAKKLEDGIIVGIGPSLMLKAPELPLASIFAASHSSLPDSKAAAKLVEFLDAYFALNIDYHPLLEKARRFEEKLKSLLQQGKEIKQQADKKTLSYFG